MSTLPVRGSLLSVCLLATSVVHAGVLLEKITLPGYGLDIDAVTKHCSIQDNGQLTIQLQVSSLISKRSQSLQLSKATIKSRIDEAAAGIINTYAFNLDGPTITYNAYQKQPDGTVKTILLYKEDGASGSQQQNNSDSAIRLRNFIDLNCEGKLL